MSDVVAASPSVALRDARLVALDDGREIDVPELDVGRDELVAIEAAGPRGDPNRRRRTVPHPVVVRAGPYRIWGDAHAMPGADPIATARWRNPNLPLTDVRVRYLLKGSPVEEQISVLVVNLELVDSLIDAEMQRWEAEAEFERDMAASVDGVH